LLGGALAGSAWAARLAGPLGAALALAGLLVAFQWTPLTSVASP
jgi:hypothetical protein